ncbi:Phosphoglycolate phosphatase (plasmid) [Streptomyces sp. enrichment culture]|uniref:HAD family hydrolase n=1 Tax=Streptomyces TaxID=1883 RepID=UPI00167AD36F|nr:MULTISPECIES: HAD family phosphatase [Streptomyces]MBD3575478.1 HAD family phosphatase [Streptomyces sp. KD18]GGS93580.1 haloacid dehalogenase [Streptomyces toxytricini]
MKAVLFDMFGVIARLQSPASRAALEAVAGGDPDRFWEAYWAHRDPYDRGDVDGPAYWQGVCAALGTTPDERLTRDLIAADLASWSEVDDRAVALLADLAGRGVALGLLSNIPEELAARYEATQPWLERFAVRGLSCRIGSTKPDAAAYEWCLRELGLPPGEVLFVDDREDNVRAARELGMQGHLFTGPEALRTALRAVLETGRA